MISPALEALKMRRQFIVYKLQSSVKRPGKTDKYPCDFRTGHVVSAHEPQFWTDSAIAIAAATRLGDSYGIGFVLTPECKLFCLDIDNCLLPNNTWSQFAKELCNMFPDAAIEVSQSGKGLHIWGTYTGDMPNHGSKNVEHGIELYTEKRFIALGSPDGANGNVTTDCTMWLHHVIAAYFPPNATSNNADCGWTTEPCKEWRGPDDDDELIIRASRSQSPAAVFGNKASFTDLWTGNAEALGRSYSANGRPYDASSADAALAQHLAFWTGKNCERIERLMERSGIVRDKFDRTDGQYGTYLRRTISNAVARQIEVLTDKVPAITESSGLNDTETALLQHGTQDKVALIFRSKMAGKMLYDHSRSSWLEWDDTRWKLENTDKALDFARAISRLSNWEGKSSLGTVAFCDGVEKFCRADRSFAVTSEEFDKDNYLLNTPSGTFDLRTHTLRKHNPDDRITLCTAVSCSTDGGNAFEKFLAEITLGDEKLAEFLQVSLGACLSGAVESHWMLFWIGQGRNGKNTLGELVQDAMGDYARKIPTTTLMAKAHDGHPTELASLKGIRLALSSELNDGDHWNESRINELTGDGTISARFMRGDFFTFQRTHKHLIYGNHRPQLRTVGNAIKSRIKIVPFNASFLGKEDGDLPRRLRENLGYVLAWLIEGHRRWLATDKRLPQCQAVDDESKDYFAAQSTVDMWLAERTQVLNPDERPAYACSQSSELYKDYADWKKNRGENPISQTRWAESMRRFKKHSSNGCRYSGLVLMPQFENTPFPLSPNAQPSHVN